MTAGSEPRSFVTPPPTHIGCELRRVVSDQYGPVLAWETLGGEDDLNVRVELATGSAFLKVSWVDAYGFADFQTGLIDCLSTWSPALPVPVIIPTAGGARSVVCDGVAERPLHLRMTTLLSGVSARGLLLDNTTVHAVGQTVARLDEALGQVQANVPARPTNWDIMSAADVLTNLIPATTSGNDEHRAWRTVLEGFIEGYLPELEMLPTQIIHNDLNGSNLLVDTGTHRVTGLFDFGDVVVAPRVVDLAVAAAYLVDGSDVGACMDSLVAMITGYRSLAPLTVHEIGLIPEIMKARYALALLLNSARADASDDAAYIQYVHRNTATSRAKLALLTDLVSQRTIDELLEKTVSGELRIGRVT